MIGYQFTPQATEDLFEIWRYIASDNLDAANRVEDAIHEACVFVAGSPRSGRIRKDLTALPIRFWIVQPFPNYTIVYDPETKPLRILRVLHGARNISSILHPR